MGAKQATLKLKALSNESGQSMIEFVLAAPLLLIVTIALVRVSVATQMSIVDQKYARSQALFITYNSSVFPRYNDYRLGFFEKQGINQMIIGVQEESMPEADADADEDNQQKASTYNITRRKMTDDGSAQEEPEKGRALVRIRNTVSLCTQVNAFRGGSGYSILSPEGMTSLTNPGDQIEWCHNEMTAQGGGS